MPVLLDIALTRTASPEGGAYEEMKSRANEGEWPAGTASPAEGAGARSAASKYDKKSRFDSHMPLNQSPSTSSASAAAASPPTPCVWNLRGENANLRANGTGQCIQSTACIRKRRMQ